MGKLKKCPFCGNDAEVKVWDIVAKGYGVRCTNIDCIGGTIGMFYSKEKSAIEAWNRRCCSENERILDFITQNDSEIQYAIEHKDRKMLEDIFFDCFNELETTFDLESVIEQLKELKTYKLNMADAMSELMNKDKLENYVCLEDVIEILNSVAKL